MPDRTDPKSNEKSPQQDAPGFFDIVLSAVAAAFGVQSKRNYQRDFKSGNLWAYIAAGLVFTTLFVLVLATVVSSVLQSN